MKHVFWMQVILLFSCANNHPSAKTEENPLYKEVMAIHDKVMPEMATIHALKRDLKALESTDKRDIVFHTIEDLEEADEAMMVWMAAFRLPEDKTQQESYLLEEKDKISKVSDQMYQSIQSARILLDSLKQTQMTK